MVPLVRRRSGRRRLAAGRTRLRRPRHGLAPIAMESRWLADLVGRHDLPLEAAVALLDGMRSDLTPAAGLNEENLLRYCFRVAGAVGVLMCPILGLHDRRFLSHAAALGMGMQLTNIARDVAEDWRRSRCYLPLEWTDGLRPDGGPPDPERVRRGVRRILDVADGYYAAGEAGIGGIEPDSRLAVRAAARIYHAIGTRIRKRDCHVLDERAHVSTLRKVRLFALAAVGATGGGRGIWLDDAARRALATAERHVSECGVSWKGGATLGDRIRRLIMKWGAWSVVFTGLSLTSVMAVVLFILVAINPKDASYGSTPLIYAAGCAISALTFNRAAAWAARRSETADP
ncbi:MAG: phytoene/squalene synthase family protein [Planctomycetia bacterium]|nr:phytoene/squalene synthase family protein [Planctomycetia bacterium]